MTSLESPLDSSLVGEAVTHLGATLHPQVYNHSVRTFLLGREAARRDGVADLDDESLCIAALFHDAGTAEPYNGPARFEVEGADAAATFLLQRGLNAAMADRIWEAIALHTTPGVPERRGPIAHYLRRGVEIEFGSKEVRARSPTASPTPKRDIRARTSRRSCRRSSSSRPSANQPRQPRRPGWRTSSGTISLASTE